MTEVNPDAIPAALRDRDQWLLWDERADRPRRPHWDGDHSISWSDPDEWHSFGEAVAKAQANEGWGIGYVTAADNPDYPRGIFGVIDIDNGADEKDHRKDWVPDMRPFSEREAYIEWSPSHQEPGDSGIHIPIAGIQVPDWWADTQMDDHEGVDVLTNKFCTFTGDDATSYDADSVADYGEWIDEWLADAYEALTGETAPPRQESDTLADPAEDAADSREDWLDEAAVAEALEYIDAKCEYPQWRNIGFALADHFPTGTAERLFVNWSRSSSKWDSEAERLAERIIQDEGGGRSAQKATIGTVVHLAQEQGWEPPTPSGGRRTPTPKELIARHSDEFETASDVPDDVLAGRHGSDEEAAESDAASDSEPDDGSGEQTTQWERIYQMYIAAEKTEERLSPRQQATIHLLETHDWRTIEESDGLWHYEKQRGIYRDNGESKVRELLVDQLEEQYRKQEKNEILDQLRGRTTIREEEMGGPDRYICCENDVIEVSPDGVERHDHDPEYQFIGRVATEYDPDANCSRFKEFLDESVDDGDDKKKLQEFAGYCLHHWGLPIHKALFLVGPTASGKSTFLDTIRTMIGDDSTASLTPQQMTQERFGGAELYGTWANIRNDIPNDLIENTGMFKELVAGDPVKAEEKYEQPFMFEPTAKHMFSANELPEADADDRAFFRRILLVAFPHETPRSERDHQLGDKLQDEHPGILNWALEGLQRLMRRSSFTGDRSEHLTEATWEKWGNSIKRFNNDCLEQDGGSSLSTHRVFQAYRAYCDSEGIPAESKQQIVTRKLKTFGYQTGREYIDGDRQRILSGASFSTRGEEFDPENQGSENGVNRF